MEPYYSKEQADALHRMRTAAGGSEFDAQWRELIADIRAHMSSNLDPGSEEARKLGRRWNTLVGRFTNGDAQTERMLYEAGEKFRNTRAERSGRILDVLGYMRLVLKVSAC